MAQLRLRFDARRVADLVAHAAAHLPKVDSIRYRNNPSYWKPGAVPDAQGAAPVDAVDVDRVPRYLILSRERETVFLVAGTAERLPDPVTPPLHRRVYAEGYAPGNPNAMALAAVLGDVDFTDDLDLRWFDDARHEDCRFVRLGLSPSQIRLLAAEHAAPKIAANRPR